MAAKVDNLIHWFFMTGATYAAFQLAFAFHRGWSLVFEICGIIFFLAAVYPFAKRFAEVLTRSNAKMDSRSYRWPSLTLIVDVCAGICLLVDSIYSIFSADSATGLIGSVVVTLVVTLVSIWIFTTWQLASGMNRLHS